MQGKIALEEHFATEDTINDSRGYLPEDTWAELRARALDIHERRIREMDKHGVGMCLPSLNAPSVQGIPDVQRANAVARRANDFLAEQVGKRSDRFQGFAALPMQDPELATTELTRCVKEFGFVGALVNGFSQVNDKDTAVYYDAPQYAPFWAELERLDVPLYLHPRNPLPRDAKIYEGASWLLGPSWAFGQETAVHALRLMGSGIFDKHPSLQIVLGHLGEGLPASIWRVDHCNGWVTGSRHKYAAKKKICDYFYANFHLTTAGNFRTQTLHVAMMELGSDKIMFSADWPFEDVGHASEWFDHCSISEADRIKIGRTNAMKLFKLKGG